MRISGKQSSRMTQQDDRRAIALIMVIVIVALLVVIAVPFAMSMRMAYRGSTTYVHQVEARLAARGAVARAVNDLYATHDAIEHLGKIEHYNTPEFDSEGELLAAITTPGLKAGNRVLYAARAEDEQGKINVNSASPWLWGNLIGSAIVTENVDSGQTDIPVDSETAGNFPAEHGMLWYHGELISYRRFDGSAFLGCTRAMHGELPEFADEGLKLREGTLIVDARAYLLAKLAYEWEDGKYHYFRTVEELRAIAEEKAGEADRGGLLSAVFSPQEFSAIAPLLTVHSWRPSGEGWIREQPIQQDLPTQIAPDSDQPERVLVDHPELYPAGSIVRLKGGAGTEYAMVLRAIPQNNQDRGWLILNKQLENEYYANSATLAVNAPHPVNINTAAPRVLFALLKGIGRNDRRVWPSNQAGGTPLAPSEAQAVTMAILRWRQDQGALRNHLDLKECLDGIEDIDLGKGVKNAVLINATYGGIGLVTRTAPFVYRSGNTFTVEGTGVVKGPRGREMARHVIREIVEVSPPITIERTVLGQAELQRSLARGRYRWLETHPLWIKGRPNRDLSMAYYKDLNELEPGQQLEEDKLGDLRLMQMEHDLKPRNGNRKVEHFRNTRDGKQVNGPFAYPVMGRNNKVNNNSGHIDTGGISGWFRYEAAEGLRCYLLDAGVAEYENRISLVYDRAAGALIGEVCDTTLQKFKSTIQAGWTPEKGVWYHIAFTWKSTHDGHLGLFVDGFPVGTCRYVDAANRSLTTTLTDDADVTDDEIHVGDTAGFPSAGALRIGNECIEYDSKTPTSFKVRKNNATPPVAVGRGARGTGPQAHSSECRVVPWGYTVRPGADLYQGNAKLVTKTVAGAFTTVNIVTKTPKFIAKGDTTIEVANAADFPPTGYALLGRETPTGGWRHEYVYFGGKTATSLTSVVRGQLGSTARNFPDQITYVIPVSIEVDTYQQYQAISNTFYLAIENEWIGARRKISRNGKRYFTYDANHQGALNSAKAGNFKHPRRGMHGTGAADHEVDVKVRPVFRAGKMVFNGKQLNVLGAGDVITLINNNKNNQREERRVTHTAGIGNPQNPIQIFSLEDFTTRKYKQSNKLTRMLKFPTGELPNVTLKFHVGGKSPNAQVPGSGLTCVLDEFYTETFGQPGAYFLAGAIGANDTDIPLTRVSGLSPIGGAIKVGDELIGYTGVTPGPNNSGTLTGCVRGYLRSTNVAHDAGAPVFNQAQLRIGKLGGDLDETSGVISVAGANTFAAVGFALIGDEIVGYTRRTGGGLEMPRNADDEGAYRGRYGTEATEHDSGTLVLWFPTRYPDYYTVGIVDAPSACHFTEHFSARASIFGRVGWTVDTPSEKRLAIHALVRVDGQGSWSDEPVVDPTERQPGKLLLFTDPKKFEDGLGIIDRFGDRIEVRFLYHFKEGAHKTKYWKTTPALKSWKLVYISAPETLHREVGR